MFKGFKEFIFKGNIVNLAIAVIIGTAFGAVVKSMVEDVLTPLIGAVVGQPKFDIMVGPVKLGSFLNAIIAFLFVAIAVYFFVILPMKAILKKKEAAPAPAVPPEPSEEVKLLREILAALKK